MVGQIAKKSFVYVIKQNIGRNHMDENLNERVDNQDDDQDDALSPILIRISIRETFNNVIV